MFGGEIRALAAASKLHSAIAEGDAGAAAALLHADVVFSDMSLHSYAVGRSQTERYLARVLDDVPYGLSSRLRHTVGGSRGGGFEWTFADGLPGITALELDEAGLITSVTSVYDSRQMPLVRKEALVASAVSA